MEHSEVYDLAGMLEHQPGAVVSRTLIKKEAGTVTLFAFDAGEGLSEHTAPYDALVLALNGQVEIRISGTPRTLAEGGAILMPAGEPHSLTALTPFKMLLVMVRA